MTKRKYFKCRGIPCKTCPYKANCYPKNQEDLKFLNSTVTKDIAAINKRFRRKLKL